ncbi:MAG TPA: pilin [Gammaproteobacteria bacterium]
MKKQLNFMFFILVIVILAWLFSPSKTTRDKIWVLKGISLAQPHKAAIAEYYERNQRFPGADDLEEDRIFVNVEYSRTAVDSIDVGKKGPGVITITYSTDKVEGAPEALDNKHVFLSPFIIENRIEWSCDTDMVLEITPVACQ